MHGLRSSYHTDGVDDTPALMAAVSEYASDASIVFQANTTYNIWSPITFPKLTNVEVAIEGNLSYPTSIQTVQSYVAASNYSGAWIAFTGGSNVTLRGTTDPNWGWVDGHGQQWWDVMQQDNRPYGWLFGQIDTGVIRDMKIYKPIAWNFLTTKSNNLRIYNNTILARSDNASFPFNTDGFSAGVTNLVFEYNHVVNGDDCLTVVNGTKNITWRNSYCEGSHGLSVGSLGEKGQVSSVENVLFENTIMNRTLYAARFKSWMGDNGAGINMTWRNIVFLDVPFPIYVTQNVNETHIENVVFDTFVGVINDTPGYVEGSCVSDPCWYNVPGATSKEVVIFDLYPNTGERVQRGRLEGSPPSPRVSDERPPLATNIVARDLFVRTLTGAPAAVMCNASTITTDVGFVCWDGPYIPTPVGL